MKILLIYPPVTIYGSGNIDPHPPLGLAYLAAYLEKNGHEVKILDALAEGRGKSTSIGKLTRFGLTDEKIKRKIADFQPNVVGVSVMFTAFVSDAEQVAKITKSVNRNIVIVFGGAHVSIDPIETLKNKAVDYAIKGEGEISFLNLLSALQKKEPLSQVAGLTYRQKKQIIQNPAPSLIKNLDDLPYPARHLLPMSLYSQLKDSLSMCQPSTSIITSRGCPGNCVYCSVQAIWGRTWRARSPKNVVNEIQILIKKYDIREVRIQDDSVSIDGDRLEGICDEIIKRKIDIKWTTPNGIAHWTLNKKLIKKMKQSGCYRITFGIESGDSQMRRWIGKPYSLKQAKELTKYANKIGLWTVATNIIGFPYETKKQIEKTINFAIKSDVDFALFFRLGPRPGTPIYDIFEKEGWLPKNKKELFSESVACKTKYFKEGELFKIQNLAYTKFLKARVLSFLNPIRIFRKINSLEDFIYVSHLSYHGIRLIMSLIGTKTGVTSKALRV